MKARRHKFDRIPFGFLIGLIGPLLIFIAVFLAKGKGEALSDYIVGLRTFDVLPKLLALCVFPDLFLFLFLMKKRYDMAARGVMVATFIYAFVIVFLKLI